MTIWFDLCLNNKTLGLIEITRTQPHDPDDPDDPTINDITFTYSVAIDSRRIGTVDHCYGDGVFALIEKASVLLAASLDRLEPRERPYRPTHSRGD